MDLANRLARIDGAAIPLSEMPSWEGLARKLREGEELILGIRPEHITIHATEMPQAFPGELYVTQPLGTETIVIVRVGDKTVSIRLFTDEPPHLSGQVWLKPDPHRIFLYRSDGGLVE